MSEHAFMTSQEVMDYLRISRSKLYRMMESGALTSYRVGEGLRFKHEDVQGCVVPNELKDNIVLIRRKRK